MSPHAVTASPIDVDHDAITLKDFSISSQGFLPAVAPLDILPNDYYAPWELLVHNLPKSLQDGSLRLEVESLDVLSTASLLSEAEWRRAYVILTFLAQAYIWGGPKPAEILPPAISVPLLSTAEKLDMPPVLTYAASNLWNFVSEGISWSDPDGLRSIHTFTGTEDESWFYVISVAIEAKAGIAVPRMLQALSAIDKDDYKTLFDALDDLRESICQAGLLLERMYERCRPMVFFNQIRPFLAGSKNMGTAGLSNGVYFSDGEGGGRWMQLRGGSNGQSSLIQFFDIVLGVTHHDSGTISSHASETTAKPANTPLSFHEEVQAYMPAPHRRLLKHIKCTKSLREFVILPRETPEHHRVRDTYSAAVQALSEFRDKHIQIVTRYIILPSRQKGAAAGDTQNLATASARLDGPGEQQLTGTGGTTLIPFLKQSRSETWAARPEAAE